MPAGIYVTKRIIQGISIAVESLGLRNASQVRIELDEPPQRWVVPTGPVIIESTGVLALFTRKSKIISRLIPR